MKSDEVQAPAPPFGLAEARRQISYGLQVWEDHPRRKQIIWVDGRRKYRLTRTTFRFLLDWRLANRRDDPWKPGYCRWL